MNSPHISVILARAGPASRLAASLRAVVASCTGLAAEIIVAGADAGELPAELREQARCAAAPGARLVPERWGAGLAAATAPVVAFTTSQFEVSAAWARTLLDAVRRDDTVAGAAGTIGLAPGATASEAAVYLLRYSAFLPGAVSEPNAVPDIPGDNAAYRRAALLAHPDLLARGFWEVEFHRRFTPHERLLMLPETLATFHGPVALGAMMRERFRHGAEFGASRVRDHGQSRWRVIGAAPAVPLVLTARVARRARRRPAGTRLLASCAPALLALAGAWAAGEAFGAAGAGRVSR
jgi:hypothetical protein